MTLSLRKPLAVLLASLTLAASALAQGFPNKPIKLIVGNPPGTAIDGSGRIVGDEMQKILGQPIVIEFKTGANATIAAQAVLTAPKDGYTLLLGSANQIHPLFNPSNGIEASRELISISLLSKIPYVLFARASLPAKDMNELTAYSKAHPGQLNFGAASSVQSLVMAVLQSRTGITSKNIPYRGSPPIVQDMLGGTVDIATSSATPFVPHVQSGRVRAMVVAADKRLPELPQTPTTFELGMNVELGLMIGLWAPPGTPPEVTAKLAAAARQAATNPAVAEALRKTLGAEAIGSTPEEQIRIVDTDMKVWIDAAKATNFKP